MIKLPIQVLCLESVFENPKDTKILRPEINNISLCKYKDNISVTINIDLTNFSKILDNIDHINSTINCTDNNNFLDIDGNHNDNNQFNKRNYVSCKYVYYPYYIMIYTGINHTIHNI
ncbi:hypothetical protein MIMI_L149 [Acanthamoeba polyphaga mimivirus]|uniref:Uncharacterized protein L149 n=1 Tax=Acanthamoeba polyphaga mimivirus TaxID=212035 RepID=F8V529_MIMIV|nr:hypothetical protein MIMI_L149 [Acanthamoeba polyphaga mimivirus]